MKKIYSVYDEKSELYLDPFVEINDAIAVRGVLNAAKDERSNLCLHPMDFHLYCIGGYDEKLGAIVSEGEVDRRRIGSVYELQQALAAD